MPDLSLLIRDARLEDLDAIVRIEETSFSDPYPKGLLKAFFYLPGAYIVASSKEVIIGYAVGSANGEEGHVVSVAVDPRHRRKQIGTALLSAVTAKLVAEGVKQIQLEVRKGNAGAIAFYERMGYRMLSEIRHYYGDGEDAWVLRRLVESSVSVDQ